MEQIYNPYLPLTEYIPDGEPHVFGDRIYIYGSHDRPNGQAYCEDHYTVWSAPVGNLKDWTCHGTAYLRTQDPSNSGDDFQLWAPDAAQGPDGRYYLYYCLSFYPEIGVAVSDRPEGPFAFYGHVHYPAEIRDGAVLREHMPFDPAVLVDEDGRVFLYYGFAPGGTKEMKPPTEEELKDMPEALRGMLHGGEGLQMGEYAMVAEMQPDMVTLKEEPHPLIPGGHHEAGTSFEGHGFFEASSIRKIRDKYYFVYSSHLSHELCYAVSEYPDRDFVFGGTIVSNGDIGLDGRTKPVYPIGNNHGGIAQIGEEFCIFYHRQTNGTEFSRQGCAEKIQIDRDGCISQVEITSCGLNGTALAGNGSYPAAIACHLADRSISPVINYRDPAVRERPMVTQRQNAVFVTNVHNRATVGFKYFQFTDADLLTLEMRGEFAGSVIVSLDAEGKRVIGQLDLDLRSEEWEIELVPITPPPGRHALYLYFKGKGSLDLIRLGFVSA